MSKLIKLNLGSGFNPKQGFINVDKFGNPDVKHDLEEFPWPWEDSSVNEVRINHVLEHLGESIAVFTRIIQELYRICTDNARITIVTPFPRHDDFLADPTHVRAITPRQFSLLSKKRCREQIEKHKADSPLALYWDVDFEIEDVKYGLEKKWTKMLEADEGAVDEINEAIQKYNNVIKETKVILRVVKS